MAENMRIKVGFRTST